MEEYWSLVAFGGVVMLAASSGGIYKPDAWYVDLAKPIWTPPDWVFPVAWMILYAMIAISGWRVWERIASEDALLAFSIYGSQLALNAAWSAIFFGLKNLRLALTELSVLWLMIVLNIILFTEGDPTAGLLLLPYLLWVSFAGILNAKVMRMNQKWS